MTRGVRFRVAMANWLFRCWLCDLKHVFSNLKHHKVARWTVIVHIVYYIHAATDAHGIHLYTAALCAAFLILELFAKD